MIRVDTGIPLPENPSQHAKYPFRQLGVGDSFLAPLADRSAVTSLCGRYARVTGGKYRTALRRKDRDGEEGLRVWRIA